MGSMICKGLIADSIDISLGEIDLRSQEPSFFSKDGIQIGPFVVLNFDNVSASHDKQPLQPQVTLNLPGLTPSVDHEKPEFDLSSYPAVDIYGCADDVLTWSNLFNINNNFGTYFRVLHLGWEPPLASSCLLD
jgi:hypothetical protein